jgi:hypothetical protein
VGAILSDIAIVVAAILIGVGIGLLIPLYTARLARVGRPSQLDHIAYGFHILITIPFGLLISLGAAAYLIYIGL